MANLQSIFTFINFLNKLRAIQRSVKIVSDDRFENDVEHSFQLALVCWYVCESEKLEFDINRILKYALVHDLNEVYAGDTDPYTSKKAYKDSQKQREKNACKKFEETFPDIASIHQAIKEYEDLSNEEARFVYALDKLLPSVNTFLQKDTYYRDSDVDIEKFIDHNGPKVQVSNTVKALFDQLVEFYKTNDWYLFSKKN
jgi:putative hydrolases of HD superfamily